MNHIATKWSTHYCMICELNDDLRCQKCNINWTMMTQTSNQQNFTNRTLQVKGGRNINKYNTNNRLCSCKLAINWHIIEFFFFLLIKQNFIFNKRSLCGWEIERKKDLCKHFIKRTICVHTFHFISLEKQRNYTINKLGLITGGLFEQNVSVFKGNKFLSAEFSREKSHLWTV